MAAPPRKRPRFMGDSDESDDASAPVAAAGQQAKLDRLFDLSDDDDALPAPLKQRAPGVSSKAKEAAQKLDLFGDQAVAGGAGEDGEGGGGGKVTIKRAPRPKIDDARLAGPKGFDALREDLKHFRPKGKGKEVRVADQSNEDDLRRLLSIYQLWAHRLFPSANFADAVAAIEKVCHKRTVQSYLKSVKEDMRRGKRPAAADDGEADDRARSVTVEPTAGAAGPERSHVDADLEDEDLDALLEAEREAELGMASAAPTRTQPRPSQPRATPGTAEALFDDDEDALDAMDAIGASAPAPIPSRVASADESGYDEMDADALAAMDDMLDQPVTKASAPQIAAVMPEDDFDDFDDAVFAELDALGNGLIAAPAPTMPPATVSAADVDAVEFEFDLTEANFAALEQQAPNT